MSFHSQIDSHVLKEGYLWKIGQINKSFKQRYFVLYDDRTMSYFSKKCHAKSRSKAKGTIYLTQIKRVEFVQYIPATQSKSLSSLTNNNESKSLEIMPTPVLSKSAHNIYAFPLQLIDENGSNVSHTNVNGYAIHSFNHNNIVCSAVPPPDYECLTETQKQKRFENVRSRTKSEPNQRCLSPIVIPPSWTDSLNDSLLYIDESFIANTESRNTSPNCDIISPSIATQESMNISDECLIFEEILNHTKSGLNCHKRYSFALIGAEREWILSAENNQRLKEWLSIFHKLCQSMPVLNGWLSLKNGKNKYKKYFFVLYQNKLLNGYKNNKDIHSFKCVFDIDLRHILWLKHSETELEIVTLNKSYALMIEDKYSLHAWFDKIQSLFEPNLGQFNSCFYSSKVCSIVAKHSSQTWKDRYVALFKGYLVIFQSKTEWTEITQNMTFFSYRIFADYLRNKHSTIIPLNDNKIIGIEQVSDENCKYVFSVSHRDREWMFDVQTQFILHHWCSLLQKKNGSLPVFEQMSDRSKSIETGNSNHVLEDISHRRTFDGHCYIKQL